MDGLEEKLNAFLSSPDAMEKVMGMAKSLGVGSKEESPPEPSVSGGTGGLLDGLAGLDPKLLSSVMKLMSEYNSGSDHREKLLLSLRPYVRNERQQKLDRAAQIIRLARTVKSGLNVFGGGGEDV